MNPAVIMAHISRVRPTEKSNSPATSGTMAARARIPPTTTSAAMLRKLPAEANSARDSGSTLNRMQIATSSRSRAVRSSVSTR